jgi:penicillin-binding protein 1A
MADLSARSPRGRPDGTAVAEDKLRIGRVMKIPEKLGAAVRAHRRVFVVIVVTLAAVTWTAVGASAWFIRGVVTGLPDKRGVREIAAMAQASTLLDVHGRPAFTIFKEQRIEVPLDRVSPHLISAITAVEDQRFFDHGGLDIIRVAGAALTNFREGRTVQGGSTLTQQLARQSFLTAEKTYRRKLKEIIVAARIERQFDKREILELYLNKVYFGDGLYGAEAASLGYFGKHVSDLDLAEAALLAGLVKSPSSYAPTVDLERAIARRTVVLQAMRDAGAIDTATYDQAVDQPVVLRDTLRNEEPYGRYFKEEVRKELVAKFGWERVYQGGLRVHTTLDLDLQKIAETEVARGLEEIEQRQLKRRGRRAAAATPATADPLQGALVAMDPHTGEVRALVGGRDFQQSSFNRATQARRQPGSAFKPFVYAAALERGFSPGTLLTRLDEPVWTPQGMWVPDDGHSSSSSMTMRTALRTSSNRAAVRMLQEVGISPTVGYARRFGIGSVPSVPSLALGSGEVTLMSMAAAYAAFANEGMLPTPTLIRRVETASGEVLFNGGSPQQRVVSEATAFLMSNMMAEVIAAGTATGVRRAGFTAPAAGKTGTTNDYHDAWFVGYTPKLVTGVWVGYDMPRTIIANGYAAELAVPIWGRFMKAATRNEKSEWFKSPATVKTATICRLSGKLATDSCRYVATVDRDGYTSMESMAYTEYFVRGTEPSTYCNYHKEYESVGWQWASTIGRDEPRAASPTTGSAPQPLSTDGNVARPVSTGGSEPQPAAAAPPPGLAPAAGGATADARTPAEPPPSATPTQRRGFWSRVFNRGNRQAPQTSTPDDEPRGR